MSGWIRRAYAAPGITQIPAGPHLRSLQGRFGGTVMLMIDVSGSMDGRPIVEAARGARQFVAEAVDAHYQVGLMLWNTAVRAECAPSPDGAAALVVLASLHSASGGNHLIGPLDRCHQVLDEYTGDRVVALFGDGDLTPTEQVLERVARMKSENIRFVTRGLGTVAAEAFGRISDEQADSARVERVEDLAHSIAGMAGSLRAADRTGPR